YLPLASMTPIYLGGLLSVIVARRRGAAAESEDPGILAASGMVAGEGLAGVAIAFIVASQKAWPLSPVATWLDRVHFAARNFTYLEGPAATVVGLFLVAATSALLLKAGWTRRPS